MGQKLLLEQFHEKRPIFSQIQWIEAFATSNTTKALPLLYCLSQGDNSKIKRAALNAIATLENDYAKLVNMVENTALSISLRYQALETLVKKHPDQAVPYLLETIESKEKLYGHKVWNIVDKLQTKEAQSLLERRIETIRIDYQAWRKIRDTEEPEVPEGKAKENNEAWVAWRDTLAAKKPQYAFLYARMLASIDSGVGVKLLEHEIADVRKGAWYGLASLGQIKIIKELKKLRLNNKGKPLLRHAAYRAIDLSLIEIQSNPKREDLKALEAWYKDLEQEEMEKEGVNKNELSITPRVDWTIHQLRYHFKAMKERDRRYREWMEKQKTQNTK